MHSGLYFQLDLLEDTFTTLQLPSALRFFMAPLSYLVALLLLSSIKQRRIFFTIITSRAWNVVSVCTRQLLNTFVCFLGGSLPLTAILEFRQMSLFGIISRLNPSSIIHHYAISTLTHAKPSSCS